MKQSFRAQAGFSLIEVLVALVILGVGLMGLARLQLSMLAGTADTAAYDHAVRLANDQMELLRYTAISGALPTAGADERQLHDLTFQRGWVADCDSLAACRVTVSVRWQEPRAGAATPQREIVLHAHLARGSLAETAWLAQSGPPNRETLP